MTMLKDPSVKYRPIDRVTGDLSLPQRTWPDRVLSAAPIWCSVDLRDGNQALIEPMNRERKLRLFKILVKIGFRQIEIGFPSASQTDFDFVRCLIEEGHIPDDVTVQVLTQARDALIQRTFDSLRGAPRAIVHVYNATAPVMRRVVFGLDQAQVIEDLAVRHAEMIRDLAADTPGTDFTFQYSPEMFSGTERSFARDIVDAVSEVWGASPQRPCIINLPATVEHATPNVFADQVEWMHRNLARRDGIILSVHPHNDRGTGTAAAELAMLAGADRVEGCLFGNGERTGNVDVVNLALNLYSQGVAPGLDFSDIDAVRSTVEYCNQLPVHPRHPYVGDLVYTSFSGSHQDAIKKAFAARREGEFWEMPYLPIDPLDLGRSYEAVIRVNSQSGKGGITYLLEHEYGLSLPRRLQIEFSQVVQDVMDDTGKEQTAADIWAIFEQEYLAGSEPYGYLSHHLVEDSKAQAVELSTEILAEGRVRRLSGRGNGPIDAFVSACSSLIGEPLSVIDYHEHSLGSGADARAATYVEIKLGSGRALFGVGLDANIVTASLKALVSGLNRALRANQPAQARKVA